VPMRLAPHYCRHDPGVGHHAHPASLQACLRPTSYCPCPLSPSNVRLGCLSLRHHVWARRRRARRDGVPHPSARWQSHLQSAFPSGLYSRASLRAPRPHSAVPVQPQPTPRRARLRLAPGRSGAAAAALWAARKSRTHGGRPVGEAGAGAADGRRQKTVCISYPLGLTRGARDAVWLAQLTYRLITVTIIDQVLDIDLQCWTPGMVWDMGCRPYTASSKSCPWDPT